MTGASFWRLGMGMGRAVRTAVRTAAAVGFLIILLVGCMVVAVNISPKPFAWYIQYRFSEDGGTEPVIPPLYNELRGSVRMERDVQYPSTFGSNYLDIYAPVDHDGPLPTIIWVHGGGFIGGDKSGVETWATMVAARGYTVVSINYELAPQNHYPGPVIQLGEVYTFLRSEAQQFPAVDPQRVIIGGDSAGAQIASQFVALETNPELADAMALEAVIPPDDLVAAILYCGAYDPVSLYDADSWFGRLFVRQIGWAYFGIRNWRDSPQVSQAATTRYITSEHPSTFITDGNTGSFEGNARRLETELRENGVYVDSLYYPLEHGVINHEYQFDFSLVEALDAYDRTLDFLERVTAE